MKVLDPFSGYRLAQGNGIMHIGYFIAIWLIPEESRCTSADYKNAKLSLLISHICAFVFSLISYLLHMKDFGIIGRALDWLSILFY
jgi:hypothetical protein